MCKPAKRLRQFSCLYRQLQFASSVTCTGQTTDRNYQLSWFCQLKCWDKNLSYKMITYTPIQTTFTEKVVHKNLPVPYLVTTFQDLWTTVVLHFTGRWLSGSPIIRIGLALRVNLSIILQNWLFLKYRLSDQVQYSVMASRTSNQARSKGWDSGTYYKY